MSIEKLFRWVVIGTIAVAPWAFGSARANVWEDEPLAGVSRMCQVLTPVDARGGYKLDLVGSARTPAARGRVRLDIQRDWIKLRVDVKDLPPPSTFGTEYLTFVVWSARSYGAFERIGEIPWDDDGMKAAFRIDRQPVGLFVTAEPYAVVPQPSDTIVVRAVPRKKMVEDFNSTEVECWLAAIDSWALGRTPEDLALQLRSDGRVPPAVLQARNAIEIARRSGAETFATDRLREATRRLLRSLDLTARGDKKEAGEEAAEAVLTAESARRIAVQRAAEEREREAELAAARRRITDLERQRNEALEAAAAAERAREEVEKKFEVESATRASERELAARRALDAEAAARAGAQGSRSATEETARARAEAERTREANQLLREQLFQARLEAERARLESEFARRRAEIDAEKRATAPKTGETAAPPAAAPTPAPVAPPAPKPPPVPPTAAPPPAPVPPVPAPAAPAAVGPASALAPPEIAPTEEATAPVEAEQPRRRWWLFGRRNQEPATTAPEAAPAAAPTTAPATAPPTPPAVASPAAPSSETLRLARLEAEVLEQRRQADLDRAASERRDSISGISASNRERLDKLADDQKALSVRQEELAQLAQRLAAVPPDAGRVQLEADYEARKARLAIERAAFEKLRAENLAAAEAGKAEAREADARRADAELAAETARRDAEADRAEAELAAETARREAETLRAEAEAAAEAAADAARRAEAEAAADAARREVEARTGLAQAIGAEETKRGLVVRLENGFVSGSSAPRPESRDRIAGIVTALQVFKGLGIEVEGHSDDMGKEDFNLDLSGRRAAAVAALLVENGIPAASVVARGFGETAPIADNRTSEGRRVNRRVELIVRGDAIGLPSLARHATNGKTPDGR